LGGELPFGGCRAGAHSRRPLWAVSHICVSPGGICPASSCPVSPADTMVGASTNALSAEAVMHRDTFSLVERDDSGH